MRCRVNSDNHRVCMKHSTCFGGGGGSTWSNDARDEQSIHEEYSQKHVTACCARIAFERRRFPIRDGCSRRLRDSSPFTIYRLY